MIHVKASEHAVKMEFLDGFLALLAEGQMPQQDRGVEAQRVHVFRCGSVDFATASKDCTLCFSFRGCNNVRHPHQSQQFLAFVVVLPSDPHSPSGELLHLFGRTGLFGLLVRLCGLTLPLKSFREDAGLELWWGAIENVERLDAIVDYAKGAVEHAHEMRGRLSAFVGELLAI